MAIEQVSLSAYVPLEFLPVQWTQTEVSIKTPLTPVSRLCKRRSAMSQFILVFSASNFFRCNCGFRTEAYLD